MSQLRLFDHGEAATDVVVLLHGLFASRRSMRAAETKLVETGYAVINWGYPTLWRTLDQHARALQPMLERLDLDQRIRSINFLTHSFGGILARYIFNSEQLAKVRRVVMMAPPNAGSHLTRISLGPFSRVFPAIGAISDAPDSLVHRMTVPSGIEVGVIAASSDFIVRIANTVLPNQRDHCVVPCTHFALPKHEDALRHAIRFLKTGMFESRQLSELAVSKAA